MGAVKGTRRRGSWEEEEEEEEEGGGRNETWLEGKAKGKRFNVNPFSGARVLDLLFPLLSFRSSRPTRIETLTL